MTQQQASRITLHPSTRNNAARARQGTVLSRKEPRGLQQRWCGFVPGSHAAVPWGPGRKRQADSWRWPRLRPRGSSYQLQQTCKRAQREPGPLPRAGQGRPAAPESREHGHSLSADFQPRFIDPKEALALVCHFLLILSPTITGAQQAPQSAIDLMGTSSPPEAPEHRALRLRAGLLISVLPPRTPQTGAAQACLP